MTPEAEMAMMEQTLGGDHPDFAQYLNRLGVRHFEQAHYTEAESLFQRSLAIREEALGKEHPDVAESLNNLASLYQAQGNYAAAEPLFQRGLVIREKTLGKDHPNVAISLNNLAGLYQDQGNYVVAESLFRRSLTILEKNFGKEHPDVAKSLSNLAVLYQYLGDAAAAEPLCQRSLSIREKTLGKDHLDVANSLNSLAMIYQDQGNYAAAEPLFQRSLTILEKTLGKEHPNVASCLNNLAMLYQAQGNYATAEPLLQRSLLIQEKTLGKEHPDLANSLNNLATLYQDQGNYAAAEPLLQRSFVIREKILGKEHPDFATSLNNLATLYQAQGNYAAAAPLFQRSLTILEKTLGKDHPDTQLVRAHSNGSRRIAVLKIEQLNVTNFKCFEASTFHFHPEFNLVVGENGKGKTSLLRALAVALGGWAHAYIKDDKNLRPIEDDEIREVQEAGRFTKSRSTKIEVQGTTKIVDYQQQAENGTASWTRTRQDTGEYTFAKGQIVYESGIKQDIDFARLGADVLHYIEQGQSFDLPLIAFYECDRLWKTTEKFNPEAAATKRYSRFDPYRDSFHTDAGLSEVATWVFKEDMQSKSLGQDTPAFQAFQVAAKAAIENCTRIRFDFDQSRIVLDFDDGLTIPLEHLSDGQRTIIGLFCDLTRRAVIMNPHLGGNVCAETSGIVLIDELDLHLHPKWQRGIIENLRKTFPKVQFICTTHSPQLLGQVKADEIILLGSEMSHPAQSFGMDSNWVLRHLMGSDDRDPEVATKVDEIFEHIEEARFDEALAAVKTLRAEIGEHPELVEAEALISRYTRFEPESD